MLGIVLSFLHVFTSLNLHNKVFLFLWRNWVTERLSDLPELQQRKQKSLLGFEPRQSGF